MMTSFKENIKNLFYPDDYPILLPQNANIDFILMKKKGIARYCIAYVDLKNIDDLDAEVKSLRKSLQKSTKALWLLREVGVFIIIKTDKDISNIEKSQLVVDSTGFHAVIIQGMYLVGNKSTLFNKSKWFKYSFGESEEIEKRLQSIS